MSLFSRRDRIAIAVIGSLILLGWGLRFVLNERKSSDDLRVLRNAVEPPAFLNAPGSIKSNDLSIERVININTAGAAELGTLPMIGPSRAAAIIAYREEHGPYRDREDIMRVSGIGKLIYRKIMSRITVQDTTVQFEKGTETKK